MLFSPAGMPFLRICPSGWKWSLMRWGGNRVLQSLPGKKALRGLALASVAPIRLALCSWTGKRTSEEALLDAIHTLHTRDREFISNLDENYHYRVAQRKGKEVKKGILQNEAKS